MQGSTLGGQRRSSGVSHRGAREVPPVAGSEVADIGEHDDHGLTSETNLRETIHKSTLETYLEEAVRKKRGNTLSGGEKYPLENAGKYQSNE